MNRDCLLSFGRIEMRDSYAVITCKEDVNIDFNEVIEVQSVFDAAYRGKRIGLITNRKNHYSVNPLAIKELFSAEYLVAGAIVGYSEVAEQVATMEAKFIRSTPINVFGDIDSATNWILDTVKKDCSNSRDKRVD